MAGRDWLLVISQQVLVLKTVHGFIANTPKPKEETGGHRVHESEASHFVTTINHYLCIERKIHFYWDISTLLVRLRSLGCWDVRMLGRAYLHLNTWREWRAGKRSKSEEAGTRPRRMCRCSRAVNIKTNQVFLIRHQLDFTSHHAV